MQILEIVPTRVDEHERADEADALFGAPLAAGGAGVEDDRVLDAPERDGEEGVVLGAEDVEGGVVDAGEEVGDEVEKAGEEGDGDERLAEGGDFAQLQAALFSFCLDGGVLEAKFELVVRHAYVRRAGHDERVVRRTG